MIGATLTALALSCASAQDAPAPRLQLIQLTGRLQVRAPEPLKKTPGFGMPIVPSGSLVRVLSGAAWFESDLHAVIQAKEGSDFRFAAFSSTSSEENSIRVSAGGLSPDLDVVVGSRTFHLGRGGELTVTALRPGEVAVESEYGRIRLASVPDAAGFLSAPLSPFFVSVSSVNVDTLDAQVVRRGGDGRADLAERADQRISDWPSLSRQAAELMLEKYGPPTAVGDNVLVWDENLPWKRTVVYRTSGDHAQRQDVLEQVVTYDVPRGKIPLLAEFDDGVKADHDRRELSAVSEREDTNFLAINVAHQLLTGRLNVTQARALYTKTILLSNAGKSSPLMGGLTFTPPAETPAP